MKQTEKERLATNIWLASGQQDALRCKRKTQQTTRINDNCANNYDEMANLPNILTMRSRVTHRYPLLVYCLCALF